MSSPTTARPAPATMTTPPLEPGDQLTRDEFERRYKSMSYLKKAELIEGVVYMAAAVRWDHHASPHAALVGWLVNYWASTPGTQAADNASIRLDLENMPQPDGAMLVLPTFGGRATISEDDYVEKGPELVAEVAASNVSIDLNRKLRVYQRNGIPEYLVWRVEDCEFDWFTLKGSTYQRLEADAAGVLKSEVFPGLWLDTGAMAGFDLPRVFATLRQGLATPGHAEFLATLRRAAEAKG